MKTSSSLFGGADWFGTDGTETGYCPQRRPWDRFHDDRHGNRWKREAVYVDVGGYQPGAIRSTRGVFVKCASWVWRCTAGPRKGETILSESHDSWFPTHRNVSTEAGE